MLLEYGAGLAGLVLSTVNPAYEAAELGLGLELDEFADEASAVSDALTYCDLTTGPAGERTTSRERLSEIERRYGADHPVARVDKEAHVAEIAEHEVPAGGERVHHGLAQRAISDQDGLQQATAQRAAAALECAPYRPQRRYLHHNRFSLRSSPRKRGPMNTGGLWVPALATP